MPEMNETVPAIHDFSQIKRSLLADKPRVTRYKISWDPSAASSAALSELNTKQVADGVVNPGMVEMQ